MSEDLATKIAAAGVPLDVRPARVVYGLALDEEPGQGADRMAARLFAADVASGLSIFARACGAERAVLLVRRGDAESRERLSPEAARERVECTVADEVYPAAPPGALTAPAELLRHVSRAVTGGAPMVSRLLAVAIPERPPAVVEAPIGTRLSRLLEVVDADAGDAPLFTGGALRAIVSHDSAALGKRTDTLLRSPRGGALPEPLRRRAVDACLQCHICTDLCPPAQLGETIAPHRALRALLLGESEGADLLATQAAACTRCGVCFVACPFALDPRAAYDTTGVALSSFAPADRTPELRLPRRRAFARFETYRPESDPQLATLSAPIREVSIPLDGAGPRVTCGRTVRPGDLIAEGSVAVHASIAGRVISLLSDRIVITQ